MAEVKRFSGRTYGKSQAQEPSASKSFDDVFAKPKQARWGKVSYVKPRHDEDEMDKKPAVIDLEEDEEDPFSFEFDCDKPAKKKVKTLHTKTAVTQPAVRIASMSSFSSKGVKKEVKTDLDDDFCGDVFTVKKGNARTYSKVTGLSIKQENERRPQNQPRYGKRGKGRGNDLHSNQAKGQTSADAIDLSDDLDDGFYIEQDDGSSDVSAQDEIFSQKDEKEEIFRRPRVPKPSYHNEQDTVTVRFRSRYLNPEVYSKFTENVTPKDPIGSLSNSKVVHKNVLKHDSGTTLIVVCSPKVGDSDIKQSNTQSKYFKDNVKDLVKSQKKPVERLTRSKRGVKTEDTVEEEEIEAEDPTNSRSDRDSESPVSVTPEENVKMEKAGQESSSGNSKASNPNTFAFEEERAESPEVRIEDIVTKVKAAPPRKYHRIFRSRNKGYMDPNQQPEEQPIEEPPPPPKPEPTKVRDKGKKSAKEKTPEAKPADPPAKEKAKENGETENSENSEAKSEPMDTQSSSQEEGKTSTESSENIESDIDSSQQSNTTDSQQADNENSSQEVEEPRPKKIKTLKTPPAERKIFRARGNKGSAPGAVKKIFSSPKKAAAVYNVRSTWQDDEEMPELSKPASGLTDMSPPALPEPPKLKPAVKKGPTKQPTAASAQQPQKAQVEMPKLTRAVHWQQHTDDDAYTSLHVNKEHRDLFTVVKNVKEAHECQEHGETQEFDDDIEYLLAGIESIEPMSTRCASCISLAQKCTLAAFRMHLRAHGTVTKIFGCLQDAAADPSLALCTSALMYMLSRDRLNMDLDQESLNLMLRLLGVDQQDDSYTTLSPVAERALKRNKDKVLEVYIEFLQQSGTKQDSIDTDCLSTGNLAMESLLSLTSRRAGEWFKEELRTLGALDHIVDTVCSCIELLGDKVSVLTNSNVENLKKVSRCLRVLENVTYLNSDNQSYLVSYKDSGLIPSLSRALRTCRCCLAIYPLAENDTGKVDKESFGWVIYSCILAILRVFLNLTHDNDTCCMKIGEQVFVIETVLLCILQSPQFVPSDLRFDLYVLSLGLLINLMEHSDKNRDKLLTLQTQSLYEDNTTTADVLAYISLVEVFKRREEAAQQLEEADEPQTPEKSPNKSGEWKESDSGMEWIIDSAKKSASKGGNSGEDKEKDLDDEETFTKALHKAGKHMENSIVAAYVALLVGCLVQENEDCKANVKAGLPNNSFEGMIYMLKKFLGFMNLTSGTGSAGGKSIERVIEILEKC